MSTLEETYLRVESVAYALDLMRVWRRIHNTPDAQPQECCCAHWLRADTIEYTLTQLSGWLQQDLFFELECCLREEPGSLPRETTFEMLELLDRRERDDLHITYGSNPATGERWYDWHDAHGRPAQRVRKLRTPYLTAQLTECGDVPRERETPSSLPLKGEGGMGTASRTSELQKMKK